MYRPLIDLINVSRKMENKVYQKRTIINNRKENLKMTNVERQKRKFLKRVYSQCLNVCNHENQNRFKISLLEKLEGLKKK